MSVFSKNLRFLRGEISQQDLGKAIGLTRSDINNYERNNSYPPVAKLLNISGYFKFNINALLTEDLQKLPAVQLEGLRTNYLTRNGGLQVLAITVDAKNKNNIDLVGVKAHAGYLAGYGDREFIAGLPKFQIPPPILAKDRIYRAFQIAGDSMLPIRDKSWIACYFVDDWNDIKNGQGCVLVTQEEGLVFKRVYSKIKENGTLLLVSLNPIYKPYEINIRNVQQVWKFALKFSDQMVEEMAG
jgi:transcriptional regulator with XRE-family HTH domain